MRRLTMVASAIMLAVMLLFFIQGIQADTGIVADDPEEQNTWSENELRRVNRVDVRGGLYTGGVEYFRDAHQRILVAQAQEAGYTKEGALALVAEAVQKFKKDGVLGGIRALTDFYVALDVKRSEKEQDLAKQIRDLQDQVAKLRAPANSRPVAESVKVAESALDNEGKLMMESKEDQDIDKGSPTGDPLAIAREAIQIAREAKDTAVQVDSRVTDLEAKWEAASKETNDKLDSLGEKIDGIIVPPTGQLLFLIPVDRGRIPPPVRRKSDYYR